VQKPAIVFDRDREWGRLVRFVDTPGDEPQLGLVYGRRRQGKSLLTSQLCEGAGGFYWEALDTEAAANLVALGAAWGQRLGVGEIRFASWDEALDALVAGGARGSRLVVLDEIQRVISRVPELPSLLQRLLGPAGVATRAGGTRLVLCGSALGDMRRLLDGTAPLRGRAALDLVVEPFGYREAAAFWGLERHADVAFRHHALVGGTPAYRSLAGGDAPQHDADLARWVADRLLDPSSSLFREGRIVVSEDPQLGDQQLYWGLLSAIASGARRWAEIERALGVRRGSLQHALGVALDAGWLRKVDDPLRSNRAVYALTEPMVRFHRLVIEPNQRRLALGQAAKVWRDVDAVVAAQIYGPHLETLAAEWLMAHADPQTLGGTVNDVGPTVVDGVGQIDLVAVEPAPRGGQRPLLVGEAKATVQRVGVAQLERLDAAAARIRAPRRGRTEIRRLLVSVAGFTAELRREADRRPDVVLADIDRLYRGN
jgi:uncharacterized protein